MSFFDDLYKQIFSRENNNQNIDIKEKLVRTDEYLSDYLKWKETKAPLGFLKEIKKAYELKQSCLESDLHISIYNSIYANGFFFTYNNRMNEKLSSFTTLLMAFYPLRV